MTEHTGLCRLPTMRTTGALLKVIRFLLDQPSHESYGLEMLRGTGLKSGTIYPLLARLETTGWVTSRWETTEATDLGRPRRRIYQLTSAGAHEGRQLLLEIGVVADPGWSL